MTQITMKEKDSECINCRTLIFVAAAFFCTIVGVAKTTNSGVSGKVLYANDSLYVEVSNNSNDTIYVFDTYLKKYWDTSKNLCEKNSMKG